MELRECLLLLPGHGLDDFPRLLPSEQADQLLASWVALWHPQFIMATKTAPRWQSAAYAPADLTGLLLVLPDVCAARLPLDFREQVSAAGSLLLAATPTELGVKQSSGALWLDFQSKLLDALGPFHQTSTTERLRGDFAALGYAYLQIQLMTRQLRYTSNLDELLFNDQVHQAALASVADDFETAERMLQSCFDQLGQERDHYYSLEVKLIDITLLAPSTLGTSLEKQLDAPDIPTSIVASAALLRDLQGKQPDNFQKLTEGLTKRDCCLAGGLDVEHPHPLMTPEAVRRDLQRGRIAYAELNLQLPEVFARYSYGILPEMPLYLKRAGFTGALLVAWEQGDYPQGNQAKISWESSDGVYLSTLAPEILDASDPACFLTLGLRAGEALDREQAPALMLAHWPARGCAYYRLLQRIAKRTPALGKWTLVDDYFDNTDQPYHQDRLASSQFRMDWLNPNPPGQAMRVMAYTQAYQQLHAQANAAQNLANMLYQLENFHRSAASPAAERKQEAESSPVTYQAAEMTEWAPELAVIWNQVDTTWQSLAATADVAEIEGVATAQHSCRAKLQALTEQQVSGLARHLSKQRTKSEASGTLTGKLVINPTSCPTRLKVRTPKSQGFGQQATFSHTAGIVGDDQVTLVDVPGFGFVLSEFQPQTTVSKSKQRALVDATGLLQNEFLEAQIDPSRGLLSSLHVPGKRGNRLSFSVARRTRHERDVRYSDMRSDRISVLTSSSVLGELRVNGKIVDNKITTGEFEIDYTLWRGSRILEINLRLTSLASHGSDPWLSADVLRFAWPTESAILRTFATGARESVAGGQFVAPSWLEIDETDYRTQLLFGGCAFHRRVENRFLETLVAVAGQREAQVRLAIAIDLPFPSQAAEQFSDSTHECTIQLNAPEHGSGWLFNIDAKNTKLDLECPLLDSDQQLVGQRLRLLETVGKITNANVRFLREVLEAYRVDDLGNRLGKLTVSGDNCTISLRANERALIDVLWK